VHTEQSSGNTISTTLERDRPQRDRPVVWVIAQQYSSAAFVSLRLHSLKKKLGARFKNVTVSIILLF
jgi:hypothetical protein